MSEKIYFYPVWLRIWHTLNALCFLMLIATGISMQYSDPAYPIIPFDTSVSLHNLAGVILTFNYLLFVFGNLISTNRQYYKVRFKGLYSRLKKQFIYYVYGIFKGEKAPFPINRERKFNPLQKTTYVLAMFIGLPIIFITGWALLYPEFIIERVFGGSGIFMTDILHVVVAFLLSIFMIIHIYFATIGPSPASNFKGIVNGWHETHD